MPLHLCTGIGNEMGGPLPAARSARSIFLDGLGPQMPAQHLSFSRLIMIATILIAQVAFWLVHNAFEASRGTALLECRDQPPTCEATDVQPFVHQPDLPEHEQLASHNPEQPPGVLDTTPVWVDVGIPGFDIRPLPKRTHLMGPASDLGWLGAVV